MLVGNLGLAADTANNQTSYTLGAVFLQNYYAQFAYLVPDLEKKSSTPMAVFYVQPGALPGTTLVH